MQSVLRGALLLAVGGFALALRLPHHQSIPAFTDERNDIFQALRIVREQELPLTNDPSYIGSFWNYLLAVAFWIGGEELSVPRTVVLVLGVVGVLAVYPLGRAWGGTAAGVLASLFLATSAGHIAFTSRVAWSHSTTPLFVTLGLWALTRIGRTGEPVPLRWLMVAALAWGLAVQTHPTALALLPGAALFVVMRQRSLMMSWKLALAALAFALVNANLLVYNLLTGFESVSRSVDQAEEYADGAPLSIWLYLQRLGLLLTGLLQSLSGSIDLGARPDEMLGNPAVWPMGILALTGVIWQWRRGNQLPALALLSVMAMLPLVNGKYNLAPNGRYLAPLLPILYAAAAALLVDCLKAAPHVGSGLVRRSAARVLARSSVAALAVVTLLYPLVSLQEYYAEAPAIGWTNRPVFAALETVEEHPDPAVSVLLDRSLNVHHAGWGNGTPRDAFELGLTFSRTPYRVVDLRNEDNTERLLASANRCRDQLVILAPRDPEENAEVVDRLGLVPVEESAGEAALNEAAYPVYRLPRAPTATRTC